eukprot:COSAG01_NODE_61_length_29729_cov_196.711779_19_plen_72_part_00
MLNYQPYRLDIVGGYLSDFKRILKYLKVHKSVAGTKLIKNQRDYVLFKLLFHTGLRKSEVLNLRKVLDLST